MAIERFEEVEVFMGVEVGKGEYHAVALDEAGSRTDLHPGEGRPRLTLGHAFIIAVARTMPHAHIPLAHHSPAPWPAIPSDSPRSSANTCFRSTPASSDGPSSWGGLPTLPTLIVTISGAVLTSAGLMLANHGSAPAVGIPIVVIGIFLEAAFTPAALTHLSDISADLRANRSLILRGLLGRSRSRLPSRQSPA